MCNFFVLKQHLPVCGAQSLKLPTSIPVVCFATSPVQSPSSRQMCSSLLPHCTAVVVSVECRFFLPSPVPVAHTAHSFRAVYVRLPQSATWYMCVALNFVAIRRFMFVVHHASTCPPTHTHTHALSRPYQTWFLDPTQPVGSECSSINRLPCVYSFPVSLRYCRLPYFGAYMAGRSVQQTNMATGFLRSMFETVCAILTAKEMSFPCNHSCCVYADSNCHVCRPEDYWLGYKFFCFAYYSHSIQHEMEFQNSKLGSCICFKLQLFGV